MKLSGFGKLERYLNYEFSSGCETGEDYKAFQRQYISYLRQLGNKKGWELVNVGKNHYCFSAFYKIGERFVYISISDVRHFKNEWYNGILVRTATSDHDYTGGSNNFCCLARLEETIENLIRRYK